MNAIQKYESLFQVFLKGVETPIEVSQEGGAILQKIVEDKDCPPFVRINGGSYNRFEIARIVPYQNRKPNSVEDDQYHNDLLRKLEEKKLRIKNKQ